MKKTVLSALAAASFLGLAGHAAAQEATKPITVSGSFALVSDYRYRGVSQSDKEMAVQGGLTATFENGIYVGTWGSNLAGWGTFGGPNVELDLFAGYKTEIAEGLAVDAGVTAYTYPGGASKTTFFEPYAKLSGAAGPASWLAGVAYAPKQEALGNYSNTPQSRGQKDDNFYIWGDVSAAPISDLPVTFKAHLGYSDGNPGLGPNGTSVAPTGKYMDWMIGADYALGPVVVGVAYTDTDITKSESRYLLPNFAKTTGGSIAGSTVVFSLTASF